MSRPAKYGAICTLAWLALVSAGFGEQPEKPVKALELDEQTVYVIPVSSQRVTTVSFPGPISAIDAAFVSTDAKHPGLFQLAHTKGSYFFSARSLAKGAVTNVNVRWRNKTYVLVLQDSETPWLSVIFQYQPDAIARTAALANRPVTPAVLLGLLDKAKAYPLLKANYPDALAQVDYTNYAQKPMVMDYNDFEVRIEETFRFDPQDTLVFRLTLRNKTDRPITYEPQGFSLRVGERTYPQSVSDASGVMPPKSDSPAYFTVTGTPTGGRNDLSIKNEFVVLLARPDIASSAAQGATTTTTRRRSSRAADASK